MLSQENFGNLKSKSDKEESIRKAVLANIKDIEILDLIYQTNDVAIYLVWCTPTELIGSFIVQA